MDRRCNVCDFLLPAENFAPWPAPRKARKPAPTCNCCRRKQNAKRNRAYRERNKAEINRRLAERRAAEPQ